MKLSLKILSLTLFSLFLGLNALSISNYEIKRICRKQRNVNLCIKKLKFNRDLLDKGKPIEIPVYPYKSK